VTDLEHDAREIEICLNRGGFKLGSARIGSVSSSLSGGPVEYGLEKC